MPQSLSSSFPIGVRYMMVSALGFALMTSAVKLVSVHGIPVMEIVAARALVSLIISYVDVRRKGLSLLGHNKPLLMARGIFGTMALICVYYAVTTLPLAEATILQYLHPVFTAILALFFLKERVQMSTIICIALCIAGLMTIVRPGFLFGEPGDMPTFSILMALLGAFGSACAYVVVRKLSQTEDSSVIILYFPLVALPVSLVLMGGDFVVPDFQTAVLLILVGVFTQIGQVGITNAMKTEVASKATAYSYVQVIFSMVLGWALFNELPSHWTLIGGAMIMGGALVNVYGSMKAQAPKAAGTIAPGKQAV
ncbi:DMT family transporter [Sansalvadorimonas verongulae]|uniref:DMT family transporter n=1 Tax=Sansalvadorimonas verongulae TaxID=2172824 RepID=UPI0012BC4C1B|nr:DMT family transporter [Sansalvadorimonas verongulae]MTI14502.1 DMT family transporter [Sansalvadorimonas verongulae]